MEAFRWLFVDDEARELKHATNAQKRLKQIDKKLFRFVELETADNPEDAVKKIREGFFHLAFIDMYYAKNSDRGRHGGIPLLEHLREYQPACRRIVRSKYLTARPEGVEVDQDVLLTLCAPRQPLAHGLLPKGEQTLWAILEQEARAWLQNGIRTVLPKGNELERVLGGWRKGLRPGKYQLEDRVLIEEIDFLVSNICGQTGESSNSPSIRSISLDFLTGGASSALLLVGRPTLKTRSFVWLVFKIDLIDRTKQEAAAFDMHVKFQLGRSRRVEIVGKAFGSRLGAICYTFAGKSPSNIRSLMTLLDKGDLEKSREVVEELLGSKDLHSIKCDDVAVRSYAGMRSHKGFNLEQIRIRVSEVLNLATSDTNQAWTFDSIKCEAKNAFGGKISFPAGVVTNVCFDELVDACICHGDLHPGNVLMGEHDEFMLIDYRESGPGPRAQDYVSICAAILMNSSANSTITEIMDSIQTLKALWRAAWHIPSNKLDALQAIDETLSAHHRMALMTIRNFRDNFGKDNPPTAIEYATVGVAWCGYLLSLEKIEFNKRLALVCWLSVCCEEILSRNS